MAPNVDRVSSDAELAFGLTPGSFPFESRYLEVSGARLHYIDEGAGPTLLMLHGNPTWSFVFRRLIPLLRDRFRCVAPDLPGFGLSIAPGHYGFTPEEHEQIMAAFVDELGLATFTPVVQDWGGPIGLHLAGRDIARIERLIVGNTWCWPVNGDAHFERFSRLMGGPVGRLIIPRFNAFVNVFMRAGIRRVPIDANMWKAYRRPLSTPHRRLPSYVFPRSILASRAFLAQCERALLRLAAKPALIVWGDADIAFRLKERTRFEALLTDHTTVVLHGAGHYIWEDAAPEIAAAVRSWWSFTGR